MNTTQHRIGIVAVTHERIRTVTAHLGLDPRAVLPIPRQTITTAARGCTLDALLVDSTMTGADLSDVTPCLSTSGGPIHYLDQR